MKAASSSGVPFGNDSRRDEPDDDLADEVEAEALGSRLDSILAVDSRYSQLVR